MLGNEASLLSESFRQTLVSVLRTKPAGHNPLYVVTSAGSGEGKTTLCANLAIAMAGIGQRVLLIDADLRKANVHKLFDLKNERGLSDLLTCAEPLQNVLLEELFQATQVANLKVMTHGLAEVDRPGELFFSSKVEELAAMLRERFDCVLVDTGPVLLFPDARLWGKHSDGVVLIVRAGVTTKENALAVCQRFLDDGVPVLGTILNDWAPPEVGNYGDYYYGYGAARAK
jgi:capsular exopolysaccharide synthesis family protein